MHLSTAIILMFVASGLVFLNTYSRYGEPNMALDSEQYWGTTHPVNYAAYGWPTKGIRWINEETGEYTIINLHYPMISMRPILINFVVAMVILFGVWLGCEYFIRRREARKP
jgi:hypothetical protein